MEGTAAREIYSPHVHAKRTSEWPGGRLAGKRRTGPGPVPFPPFNECLRLSALNESPVLGRCARLARPGTVWAGFVELFAMCHARGAGSSDVLQGAVGSLRAGPVARGGHAAVPTPHVRGSRSHARPPNNNAAVLVFLPEMGDGNEMKDRARTKQ
jgi:hypothetical protein